ncbi:hypothetical protein PPERSA_02243 [Pseudocohnilembus persalinus]|uniref:MORN motif n=1 Tax=Pseudocohnilembus persalinus TaxID=266149 RepID=A0A0V0QKS1_PSEPJ|nr:hypothetical protein PPERSA_02243 [Pseudocohnilembus persalinus]|eukprot:KRX02753.1 hypothetical protein PPERSA_02243 [Pseudocohnilembus persalinus]
MEITCPNHEDKFIKFICSKKECKYGHIICTQCIKDDKQHANKHKNYLFQLEDFIDVQSKMSQKFIPSLAETFKEVENRYVKYNQFCEKEVQEIEKDFAALFKVFFGFCEESKQFLIRQINEDCEDFNVEFNKVKKGFQDLAKQKKDKNIFSILFNKEEHPFDKSNPYKSIENLIKNNAPLNEMRGRCIQLSLDLDKIVGDRKNYRKNELKVSIFKQIQQDLEQFGKVVKNKMQHLFDQDEEVKSNLSQSIFILSENQENKDINQQQQQMMCLFQDQQSNISNQNFLTVPQQHFQQQQQQFNYMETPKSNSSRSTSRFFMGQSVNLTDFETCSNFSTQSKQLNMEQIKHEMSKMVNDPNLKKIQSFPQIQNQKVLEAIEVFGSSKYEKYKSFLNEIPEQGPFKYGDGSVYLGHMLNNKRYGRGKLLFQNGSLFEGYWKNDVPFGYCRYIKVDGSIYEGECQNFQANGQGTMQSLDQKYKYTGEWKNDKKQGQGTEIIQGVYEYKGQFENNQFSGQGVIKFDSGDKYTGDFKDGKITGQGNLLYSNGDKYFGEVKEGKKDGKGILILNDYGQYEGNFRDDKCNGQGIFIWPDGVIYNGNWQEGKQHGKGIQIDGEGQEKVGIWENGEWQEWVESE